jgi:hypothetical protein
MIAHPLGMVSGIFRLRYSWGHKAQTTDDRSSVWYQLPIWQLIALERVIARSEGLGRHAGKTSRKTFLKTKFQCPQPLFRPYFFSFDLSALS